MGKGKKKNRHGPAELLVVEAEEFPTAVIVELWGRNAKGKREFLDSRRYDTPDDPADEAATDDAAAEGSAMDGGGETGGDAGARANGDAPRGSKG